MPPDPATSFPCPTAGCPGNCWEVLRTEPIEGGRRRIRKCVRCGAVIVTIERESGVQPSLPAWMSRKW